MPWTQSDVDDLKTAIAETGNNSYVNYSDGSAIRYLSPKEAQELLALMQRDVDAAKLAEQAATGSTPAIIRAIRGVVSSGY